MPVELLWNQLRPGYCLQGPDLGGPIGWGMYHLSVYRSVPNGAGGLFNQRAVIGSGGEYRRRPRDGAKTRGLG